MLLSEEKSHRTISTRVVNGKNELWDFVRQKWVIAEPEEWVRQRTLLFLTEQCLWPRSLIAVEKELRALPHLKDMSTSIPQRRVDILCYRLDDLGKLQPSIMIECKAIPLGRKAIEQAVGYNHYIQAEYVSLVNQKEVQTAYFDFAAQVTRVVPSWPQSLLASCSS